MSGPRFVVADSTGSPAYVLDAAWCYRIVARFSSSRYGGLVAARQKAAALAHELNEEEGRGSEEQRQSHPTSARPEV